MKKLFFACALATMVLGFISCDDEEKVTPKDYGMKTFEADMKYVSDVPHGSIAYTRQTFMKLGQENAVHVGTYGEESWTNYNLYTEADDYNVTTEVEGWDLAITAYVDPIVYGDQIYAYPVTGILTNAEEGVEVGFYEYTESGDLATISEAFANLALADVNGLEFSSERNAIAYSWKTVDRDTGWYTVYTNQFFIVKLANEDIYKVRFVGFHGATIEERIVKMEYALMQ